MPKITVYSSDYCGFCVAAHRLLRQKGIESYETINVDGDQSLRAVMEQRSGRRTVPQIFIGDRHVGGYTDLASLDQSGELDRLLAQA